MDLQTEDIVAEFLLSYLRKKGHDISRILSKRRRLDSMQQHEVQVICSNLTDISRELTRFVRQNYGDVIEEIPGNLGSLIYEKFEVIANEIFHNYITHEKIVVLLVFSSELAMRFIVQSPASYEDEVEAIIRFLTRYIDENLSQWIHEQPNGWLNVSELKREDVNTSSLGHYLGIATFTTLILGLCVWFNSIVHR